MGHCAEAFEDFRRADAFYIEALGFQPDDDKALFTAGIAYQRLGDDARLQQVLTKLQELHPSSDYTWSLYIRTREPSESVEAIEGAIPSSCKQLEEVTISLALLAQRRGDLEKSERYAAISYQSHPDNFICGQWRCITLINVVAHGCVIRRDPTITTQDKEKVQEALTIIEKLLQHQRVRLSDRISAEILCMRSTCYRLLGDFEGAARDAESAWGKAPQVEEYALKHAIFLAEGTHSNRAIAVLEGIAPPFTEADLLLARLLFARGSERDYGRIVDLLTNRHTQDDAFTVQTLRALALVRLKRVDEALGTISEASNRGLMSKGAMHVALGAIQQESKNMTAAAREARLAFAQREAIPEEDGIRKLAHILHHLGMHDEAAVVIEPVIREGLPDNDLPLLAVCALKSGRATHCMKCLASIRMKGIYRLDLIELEVHLFLKYNDIDGAVAALQEALRGINDLEAAKALRVKLAVLGHEFQRPELIVTDPDLLPAVSNASAAIGIGVVCALTYHSDTRLAVDYAYHLLRRFMSVAEVHQAVVMSFRLGTGEIDLPMPEVVAPGTAVAFTENDNETVQVLVIEDALVPSPDPARNEQSPSGPLAVLFAGKRVDDVVSPREGLSYRIRAIVDKRAYRFQEVLANYERRFTGFFVQKFRTADASGNLVLDDLIRQLASHTDHVNEGLDAYRDSLLSLALLAKKAGGDLFKTMGTLSSRAGYEIKAAFGSDAELADSLGCLLDSSAIVIAPSALCTLLHVGDYRWIEAYHGTIYITQSTLRDLNKLLKEHSSPTGEFSLDYRDGQPVRHQKSAEQSAANAVRIKELIAFIEKRFTVMDGKSLAAVSGDLQTLLTSFFGSSGAESIALAKAHNAVFHSDDMVERYVASQKLGVRGSWTQSLVHYLANNKLIPTDKMHHITIKLCALQYAFTRISPETVLFAFKEGKWDASSPEMTALLPTFADSRIETKGIAMLTAWTLTLIWRQASLPQVAELVTIRIIKQILKRNFGSSIVGALIQVTDKLFGLDVISAEHCKSVMRSVLVSDRRDGGGLIVT